MLIGIPGIANPGIVSIGSTGIDNFGAATTPSFSALSGNTLTLVAAGADSIYYTNDGSTPTTGSTLYSAPFTVAVGQTIKAIAVKANYANSAVASGVVTDLLSDDFARANGALGNKWTVHTGTFMEMPNGVGGIVLISNAFAPSSAVGGDSSAIWSGIVPGFADDQWASAKISAIAPYTSVVAITAASITGGDTTYTYTLTSGVPLFSGQYIVISGMGHAGNNGAFIITGLGTGTFTVANASGVTFTENGTGNSASDCNLGVGVRLSADGKNGYFLSIGTNSYLGTTAGTVGRVYDTELWKIVNGVGSSITSVGNQTTIADSVNDIWTLIITGTNLRAYKNSTLVFNQTVSDGITGGTPGIMAWSVNGPDEFNWAAWNNAGAMSPTGNNGTQWTSYKAAAGSGFGYGVASDNFNRANGDLVTGNANWTYNGTVAMAVSGNVCVSTSGAGLIRYSGASFPNNQFSSATVTNDSTVGGTNNLGLAVRISTGGAVTGYILRYASNMLNLSKYLAGVLTDLATSGTGPAVSDVLTLVASGNVIIAYKNGAVVHVAVDNDIASGAAGLFSAGTVANSFDGWAGGGMGLFLQT